MRGNEKEVKKMKVELEKGRRERGGMRERRRRYIKVREIIIHMQEHEINKGNLYIKRF